MPSIHPEAGRRLINPNVGFGRILPLVRRRDQEASRERVLPGSVLDGARLVERVEALLADIDHAVATLRREPRSVRDGHRDDPR